MSRQVVVIPDDAEALPKRLWVTQAISCASGAVLQIAGLYAGIVTFGLWTTLGAYAIGALTVVMQQIVVARSAR